MFWHFRVPCLNFNQVSATPMNPTFKNRKLKPNTVPVNVIHSGYTRRDYPWSCLFSFSCFNSWLAKLVKKIMLNANTAMPILYVSSMSEKKSAKTDTSISANTRTSCTPLRLPKPVLKLISLSPFARFFTASLISFLFCVLFLHK